MEYRTDKRTKNLTLRDIHVGDWVQVWSEQTERYSPPMKIISIHDDGTISNGMLYMFMSKPQRFLETWGVLGIGFFKLDESLFPEVQWSDKEPTRVSITIKKVIWKR